MAKKDLVLAIIGKKAPKGSEIEDKEMEESSEEEDEEDSTYEDCAEEMIAAIEAKDASRLVDALKTFIDHYEMKPHKEYSKED